MLVSNEFIYNFFSKIFLAYNIIGNSIYDIFFAHKSNLEYHGVSDFMEHSFWSYFIMRSCVIYGLMLFIYLPLSLIKDVGGLANVAIIGTISLMYLIIVSIK